LIYFLRRTNVETFIWLRSEGKLFDIYFCFRFAVMLYVFLIMNLIAFTVFGVDKWKAVQHKRRISEFSLLILTFLGGTVGAILAMMIFRHKVSKKSFLWKFGIIILIQIFIILFIKFKILNIKMC